MAAVPPFQQTVSGLELWHWRLQARVQTQAAGIDPAEVDWFLCAISSLDSLSLKSGTVQDRPSIELPYNLPTLEALWQTQRLEQRVPVQYLVGRVEWRHLVLQVTPDVLIPRPETELMIDLAVTAVAKSPIGADLARGIWVDLGTGSGAIALSLAQVFPQAQILAVDLSAEALIIAQKNAVRNGLGDRISFLQGSWFEPLTDFSDRLAAVVSNPPYIPSATLPTLQPEVIDHEPTVALDGGVSGLESLKILAEQAPKYLQSQGLWLCETMAEQGEWVKSLLNQRQAYDHIQLFPDLAGLDRFVLAWRR